MCRIRDFHRLAAGIVADTKHKGCLFYFLTQVELIHIIKLVWAMNHQRIRDLPRHRCQHADSGNWPSEMNMQMVMTALAQPVSQQKGFC